MKFFYENKDMPVRAEYGTSLVFGAHLHNHIEMVYMIEGKAKAFVDFKEYLIQTGDAFIVFPNQIHQYLKIDRENYIVFIFTPDLCPEFQSLFKHKIPVSSVIRGAGENSRIFPLFSSIVTINKEKSSFHNTALKGLFLQLLSELFEMIEFTDVKSSDSNKIKDILNYCSQNYTKDILLESVSKELYISKYYISHLFRQKLHMGFSEYIGMLRISDACGLLVSQDKSITEIAYSVGFNSVRSFNRSFLKYMEKTPREYRQNLLDAVV